MNQGFHAPTTTKGYNQGLGVEPSPSLLGQHLQVQQLACSPPAQTTPCLSPQIRASSCHADGAEEDVEKVYHKNLHQVSSEEAPGLCTGSQALVLQDIRKDKDNLWVNEFLTLNCKMAIQ